MSEVISFRLDRDNPREAQALAVLARGQEAGYSLRHILTEALLALDAAAEDEQAVALVLVDMAGRLEQILERLQHTSLVPVQPTKDQTDQEALAESFLLAVKNAARLGLGLDR